MSAFTDRLSDDFLNAKRARGDGPADEAIREVVEREGPKAAGRIFRTLIRRLDLPVAELPEPLPAFVRTQAESVPLPADDVVASTERIFRDHGPRLLLALYHASLPTVYLCRGMARALVVSGGLVHGDASGETFGRRVGEAGQFIVDVLGPDGMRPAGTGVSTALRVRLVHTAIRQLAPGAERDGAPGQPINQEDLALALTTFGVTIVDALESLGAPLAEDEIAAYLGTWNTVGRLLGIDDDLLPPTAPDARVLQARILERQAGDTEEGRLLARALVECAGDLVARHDLRDAPVLLIRYLTGPETAQRLGVSGPHRWWAALVPAAVRGSFGFTERLEAGSAALAAITDRVSLLIAHGMVASFNRFKGEPFRIPGSLQITWGIR